MRAVTAHTQAAWTAAVKGGTSRGWIRATIQPMKMRRVKYEHDGREGFFTTMIFDQPRKPREIEGVQDISVKLDVESGAQTCTITIANITHIAMTQPNMPYDAGNHDRPGAYSALRGATSRWGYPTSSWYQWLMPDRVIRLWEGYSENIPGWNDTNIAPDLDDNMYPCGVWLIDDVKYNADATITIECRDLARELIETICFPPVVPFDDYPMEWEKARKKDIKEYVVGASGWQRLTYDKSSNETFIGSGIDDGGAPYVGNDGGVRGHKPKAAFDDDNSTYWLSHGSLDGDSDSAFPWVQGTVGGATVEGIRVKTKSGPYKVYVSVYTDEWKGKKKVPYDPWRRDTNARIRYVATATVKRNDETVIKLPKAYTGVTKVRVTFHELRDSGIGKYRFRAQAYGIRYCSDVQEQTVSVTAGRYVDYTDIVKWLLAWSGFYWPKAGSGKQYLTLTDGSKVWLPPPSNDHVLGKVGGRVWGDFELTGTAGEAALGVDIWDKKPVLDAINYIADIVSYVFFVDETGGAVFRSPNIWEPGNWLSPVDGGPMGSRTGDIIQLADDEVLLSHSFTLSSRSRRDRIFIANTNGRFGAVAKGFSSTNPRTGNDVGTRRVAGWTDQNFKSEEECQVMADLIAMRQRMSVGQATVTIPGYPAIQMDDQVLVTERVTSTDHVFYVRGITKSYNAATGRYTYDLALQWLGEEGERFVSKVDPDLAEETRQFLELMGERP